MASTKAHPAKAVFLSKPQIRSFVLQAVVLIVIIGAAGFLIDNMLANLRRLNVSGGFGFLFAPSGFRVTEGLIPFSSGDSNGWAIIVALSNTLRAFALSAALATLLGIFIGVCRLSSNVLLSFLTRSYVDVLRNIPLLLQLFFWYLLITNLPRPRNAFEPFEGVILSNRGLAVPSLDWDPAFWQIAAFASLAIATVWSLRFLRFEWIMRHRTTAAILVLVAFVAAFVLIALAVGAALSYPKLQRFNVAGGATLSPEFAALTFGLTIYNSAFISEIVRAGLLSVSTGQREAANALGLSRWRTFSLVVFPQALRVSIPPTINQYLNILKATTLGVAIGYPEVMAVASSMIQLTGQPLEIIAVVLITFLLVSLVTSALMNWYNARIVQRSA